MGETLALGLKEKTSPPPFRVIRMDEQWAFEYGKDMKQKVAEWRAKGYPYNTPDVLRPYFEGEMSDDVFRETLHEWYAGWETSDQVKRLEACEQVFNSGINRYLPLQKWGFDIPDSYDVIVTPFAIGAGGAGQRMAGHGPVITMWYGRAWGPKNRTPEETLLHEAYHLGADQIIEKGLRMHIPDDTQYQRVRERVVDYCSAEVLVPDILPTYHFQFSEVPGLLPPHPINQYLRQTNLAVPQRLQLYARSLGNRGVS